MSLHPTFTQGIHPRYTQAILNPRYCIPLVLLPRMQCLIYKCHIVVFPLLLRCRYVSHLWYTQGYKPPTDRLTSGLQQQKQQAQLQQKAQSVLTKILLHLQLLPLTQSAFQLTLRQCMWPAHKPSAPNVNDMLLKISASFSTCNGHKKLTNIWHFKDIILHKPWDRVDVVQRRVAG